MSNFFNNANTNVTIRKYGTKYGKKIEENLIPVKDRGNKKENQLQALTEAAAKFAENTSKVNTRKLNELKEQRLYDKLIQEGYSKLKDDLFKDVMRQVCVESLLVDEDVVLENINVLHDMVDTEVDAMGGFEGLKNIARTSKNQLLENMVETIEDMCKKVGARVVQEATDARDLEFALDDSEIKEFDLKKQELGVENISDFVKERVLTVVQNEQKASQEKGEIMDEIKTKLQDAETEVPVEEAMEVIFKENVEEVSLFESLLRTGYKGLLETSSSAIFESSSFDEDDMEDDDDDYDVEDIELNTSTSEIVEDDIDDEDIERLIIEEGFDADVARMFKAHVFAIFEALEKEDNEALEEELDKVSDKSEEIAESCKSKSKATKVKESLRKVQASTEEVIDEACKKRACKEELIICPVCGEDPCVCETTLEEGVVSKARDFMDKQALNFTAKLDYGKVRYKLIDYINSVKDITELDLLAKGDYIPYKRMEAAKEKHPDAAKKIDEHINWLETEYPKIIDDRRKALKESMDDEALEEAFNIKERIRNFFEKQMAKNISKKDWESVRKNVLKLANNCNTIADVEYLESDAKIGVKQLTDSKLKFPDAAEHIDDQINWIQNDLKKILADKKKSIKASELKESFSTKINTICESLDAEIEKHETALCKALESINIEYDGETICAPMLTAKDCNLNNLEFAYKTKAVCESLKCLFTQTESVEEVKQLEEMVNINLEYIAEAREAISDKFNAGFKDRMLGMAERYLNKLNSNNEVLAESLLIEGANVDYTEAVEEVKDLYQTLATKELMEGTNNDFMEVVLAEAIVKYTIMESFSTLNIKKYSKNEIEQMARKNIQ